MNTLTPNPEEAHTRMAENRYYNPQKHGLITLAPEEDDKDLSESAKERIRPPQRTSHERRMRERVLSFLKKPFELPVMALGKCEHVLVEALRHTRRASDTKVIASGEARRVEFSTCGLRNAAPGFDDDGNERTWNETEATSSEDEPMKSNGDWKIKKENRTSLIPRRLCRSSGRSGSW
ncbi:hypothetical protein P280DRAFT_469304 [Massarina eburnea CBS 473.64]|uniref:Uncharacterized protein n=1 Tax=Massarina eburnea CBS 473.64 TaxID=1395130 RepID=A0A6A6S037_9PLEO|nr:hypothetical protein P280DRAFT_469304 [Massarina eburnea CBS 473.64]